MGRKVVFKPGNLGMLFDVIRSCLRRYHASDPHKAARARIQKMDRAQLIEAMSAYYWWHSIDLGNGIITPGIKSASLMEVELANTFDGIDIQGKSILDIGAWNGAFSIEARRRGASRVLALDHYTWNHDYFKGRETLELVCGATGMHVETVDIDLDAPNLNLSKLGEFDIVLFLGSFII